MKIKPGDVCVVKYPITGTIISSEQHYNYALQEGVILEVVCIMFAGSGVAVRFWGSDNSHMVVPEWKLEKIGVL